MLLSDGRMDKLELELELELELVHFGDLGRAFAPFQYLSTGLFVCGLSP